MQKVFYSVLIKAVENLDQVFLLFEFLTRLTKNYLLFENPQIFKFVSVAF